MPVKLRETDNGKITYQKAWLLVFVVAVAVLPFFRHRSSGRLLCTRIE